MANEMETSILKTVRKMIGPSQDYEYFDTDLIIFINTAIGILNTLGVGDPNDPFKITGESETWSDYLGEKYGDLEMIKTYIVLRVRLLFDPPATSFVLDAYKKEIDELGFRISVSVDPSRINSEGWYKCYQILQLLITMEDLGNQY